LKREAREQDKASVPAAGLAKTTEVSLAADAAPAPQPVAVAGNTGSAAAAAGTDSLPPVESLTIDSDFTAFLQPKVDEALKRRALKQLFRDPHFNVMDGLDVYIDDYTKPDPIPPEIVREMVQGRYIFDPPPTRINAQGHVEDIPPEELAALERDANAATPEAAAEVDAVARAKLPPSEPDVAVVSQPPPPPEAASGAAEETGGDAARTANADKDARPR
jgi:hypothetical protein